MRLISWTIRILAFLLLLAFAAKNTHPVELQFYFGLVWETPLIALLLVFFILGAAFGMLAVFSTVLRQRRELVALRGAAAQPVPETAVARLRVPVDG
jgi:putative membrane protein